MIKKLKYLSLFFIALFFGIAMVFQIKVENYKDEINSEYGFYAKKERLRYTPFVVFYFNSKVLKKNSVYWEKMNNIYDENGVFEKAKNTKDFRVVYNIEYNAYLNYCFLYENHFLNTNSPR